MKRPVGRSLHIVGDSYEPARVSIYRGSSVWNSHKYPRSNKGPTKRLDAMTRNALILPIQLAKSGGQKLTPCAEQGTYEIAEDDSLLRYARA